MSKILNMALSSKQRADCAFYDTAKVKRVFEVYNTKTMLVCERSMSRPLAGQALLMLDIKHGVGKHAVRAIDHFVH